MGNSSSQGGAKIESSPVLTKAIQLEEGIHQPLLEPSSQENEVQKVPVIFPSVMEIDNLIRSGRLKEAHKHLIQFQDEVKKEQENKSNETSSMELNKKEMDLKLLCKSLQDRIKDVVRDSNNQPSCSTELLVYVAQIIEEEEKREQDSGSAGQNWRDTWKMAVQEGVQNKIQSVPLDSREQNSSWLNVHLDHIGRTVLENLEYVKNQLKDCYPLSFDVFNTYVHSYHQTIGNHLKNIPQKELETKDYYTLLKWITNDYKSEKIMGSLTLQPDMRISNMSLSVEDSFLDQIKGNFCDTIKNEFPTILQKLTEVEHNMWGTEEPEMMPTYYHSEVHIDICQMMHGYMEDIKKTDPQLSERVMCIILEELEPFPSSLEEVLEKWCSTTKPPEDGPGSHASRFKYRIAYINSLLSIKEHLETYRESSPQQVQKLMREMENTVQKLGEKMMMQFQEESECFFNQLMTRSWLQETTNFQEILKRTDGLMDLCKGMKPPYTQVFVSKVHYHVVCKYISQLMNSKLSCKRTNHEMAASKIKEELTQLQNIFPNQSSSFDWLFPLGDYLHNIIEKKNPEDMKTCLTDLLNHYPDISGKHVAAMLQFQGTMGWRGKCAILNHFYKLKSRTANTAEQGQHFFSQIDVHKNNCRFFCLPVS